MAILAECPQCHTKQSVRNKQCKCGADLDRLKRSQKIRFWINYRLPGGKQRREPVGYSIEEARDADGKRRTQKRENRIFDIKPEAKMTFQELSDWYLNLDKVKMLSSHSRKEIAHRKFNAMFGNMVVNQIKPVDLESYQAKAKKKGFADKTIDDEIGEVGTMIRKAFDNGMVGGDTLRTFNKVEKLMKKRSANARDKILSLDQFKTLMSHLPRHTRAVVATGFYTGMRLGEILGLTWDKVDLQSRTIQLEASDTKDKEPRKIPIMDDLYGILSAIPRPLHHNHVFSFKGKPINSIRTSLRNACKEAGILYGRFVKGGFIYHDLRHSFNTHMRKAGVAESVIMDITGHSTREMFDRYNTVDEEDTRKAVDQLQGFFASVDQTVDQNENLT